VVTTLLDKVEANVAEAAAASKKQAGEVDDVEEEELMMLSVSAEDSSDRQDRENFIPWLRFATEAFRKVLDALRNRMEDLYHDVVRREFDFMKRYNRTGEFRRVCQHQRKHFKDHIEHRKPRMDGSAPKEHLAVESLQRHLETRFYQLETCKELNMWNEAFRTVKDMERVLVEYRDLDPRFNDVLNPDPEVLARYYEACALVAWMSDNRLLNMYITVVDNDVLESDEDVEKAATRLLISALAIPLVRPEEASTTGLGSTFGVEVQTQKMREWATLLGMTSKVTRESVLEEVLDAGARDDAAPFAKQLYDLLEQDFCPLVLVKRVTALFGQVEENEELKMYATAIKELALQRLLQQLERVYRCMHLSQFFELIAPLAMPQHEVEMLVVRAIKDRLVQARFDYKGGKLHLGMDELE
ncbi:TIF32, partial [Symbiodinium sp. KB8]